MIQAPAATMTAKQAAAYLGVPVRSIYALPIPRYTLSPRRTRWERSDLDTYKAKCRSTSTKINDAGAILSTVSLTASVSGLRSSFQKAGANVRPRPTTERKADVFTLRPVKPKSPD